MHKYERLAGWAKVVAWLTALLLGAVLIFSAGAWSSRHIDRGGQRFSEAVGGLVDLSASVPSIVRQAFLEVAQTIIGTPFSLLIPKSSVTVTQSVNFPNPQDSGYLLLSGLSREHKQSTVKLIRVADGKVITEWVPDWSHIHSKITPHRHAAIASTWSYRAIHPTLLNDGSIIFNTGTSLLRLECRRSRPSWMLDYPYHHSVELSSGKSSVWVPSVTEEFSVQNINLKRELRDDSIAEIDLTGVVLRNLSFSKILADNNLLAHAIGTSGSEINIDPIHINQITEAPVTTRHWRVGDLLISARHTSTVYLYRPSTNKIIWWRQGPWMNQHSVQFAGDSRIAIFGNDVYGRGRIDDFIYSEEKNSIYIYNFDTDKAVKMFNAARDEMRLSTRNQGRLQLYEDGRAFIEDTNNGRVVMVNPGGLLQWQFVNEYDQSNLGDVAWSRYLQEAEVAAALSSIATHCLQD